MLFVDVVLHRINHFVMACIGQLISKMIKTNYLRLGHISKNNFCHKR
jgi:hypothetical protein